MSYTQNNGTVWFKFFAVFFVWFTLTPATGNAQQTSPVADTAFKRIDDLSCQFAEGDLAFYYDVLADETNADRLAFVAGNSSYIRELGLEPLSTPGNDALDVARRLVGLGFDTVLLADATAKEFHLCFEWYLQNSGDYDLSWFYFSGHGIQFEEKNFILSIDASTTGKQGGRGYISLAQISDQLAETFPANIVVLDACRTPNVPATSQIDEKTGIIRLKPQGGFSSSEQIEHGNFLWAFASTPNTTATAIPGSRNSLFTKAILNNLESPGQTALGLFANVASDMSEDASNVSTPKQTPWIRSALADEVFLYGRLTEAELEALDGYYFEKVNDLFRQGDPLAAARLGSTLLRSYNRFQNYFVETTRALSSQLGSDALYLSLPESNEEVFFYNEQADNLFIASRDENQVERLYLVDRVLGKIHQVVRADNEYGDVAELSNLAKDFFDADLLYFMDSVSRRTERSPFGTGFWGRQHSSTRDIRIEHNTEKSPYIEEVYYDRISIADDKGQPIDSAFEVFKHEGYFLPSYGISESQISLAIDLRADYFKTRQKLDRLRRELSEDEEDRFIDEAPLSAIEREKFSTISELDRQLDRIGLKLDRTFSSIQGFTLRERRFISYLKGNLQAVFEYDENERKLEQVGEVVSHSAALFPARSIDSDNGTQWFYYVEPVRLAPETVVDFKDAILSRLEVRLLKLNLLSGETLETYELDVFVADDVFKRINESGFPPTNLRGDRRSINALSEAAGESGAYFASGNFIITDVQVFQDERHVEVYVEDGSRKLFSLPKDSDENRAKQILHLGSDQCSIPDRSGFERRGIGRKSPSCNTFAGSANSERGSFLTVGAGGSFPAYRRGIVHRLVHLYSYSENTPFSSLPSPGQRTALHGKADEVVKDAALSPDKRILALLTEVRDSTENSYIILVSIDDQFRRLQEIGRYTVPRQEKISWGRDGRTLITYSSNTFQELSTRRLIQSAVPIHTQLVSQLPFGSSAPPPAGSGGLFWRHSSSNSDPLGMSSDRKPQLRIYSKADFRNISFALPEEQNSDFLPINFVSTNSDKTLAVVSMEIYEEESERLSDWEGEFSESEEMLLMFDVNEDELLSYINLNQQDLSKVCTGNSCSEFLTSSRPARFIDSSRRFFMLRGASVLSWSVGDHEKTSYCDLAENVNVDNSFLALLHSNAEFFKTAYQSICEEQGQSERSKNEQDKIFSLAKSLSSLLTFNEDSLVEFTFKNQKYTGELDKIDCDIQGRCAVLLGLILVDGDDAFQSSVIGTLNLRDQKITSSKPVNSDTTFLRRGDKVLVGQPGIQGGIYLETIFSLLTGEELITSEAYYRNPLEIQNRRQHYSNDIWIAGSGETDVYIYNGSQRSFSMSRYLHYAEDIENLIPFFE